jgi:hypothetical protein
MHGQPHISLQKVPPIQVLPHPPNHFFPSSSIQTSIKGSVSAHIQRMLLHLDIHSLQTRLSVSYVTLSHDNDVIMLAKDDRILKTCNSLFNPAVLMGVYTSLLEVDQDQGDFKNFYAAVTNIALFKQSNTKFLLDFLTSLVPIHISFTTGHTKTT